MTSRILLINCNSTTSPFPVYPLGLSHLIATLSKAGHAVDLYDIQLDKDALEDRIAAFKPQFIGLSLRNVDDTSSITQQFYAETLVEIAKTVKSITNVPLICGGSGFSLFPQALLQRSGADFGIVGEGETAILALMDAIDQGGDLSTVPSLIWRRNGKVVLNERLDRPEQNIVSPVRPRHLVEYYYKHSAMLNVQTQRGCAFKCCYCTYPVIEGSQFRFRPASDVCDDIEAIKASGAEYFFVVDSVFNTSRNHVRAICEELVRRDLGMKWGCFLRPHKIDVSLMKLMAEAGLTHIEFGSDSLCDSLLTSYGKHFTFDDILTASDAAYEAKIHYAHFLIVGGPGESEATLMESFENSKKIRNTVFFPFIGMRIYPGTSLYQMALNDGLVSPDDDLLKPTFYISPEISSDEITALLQRFSSERKNWIYGAASQDTLAVQQRLRQKGVTGPLWEFLTR